MRPAPSAREQIELASAGALVPLAAAFSAGQLLGGEATATAVLAGGALAAAAGACIGKWPPQRVLLAALVGIGFIAGAALVARRLAPPADPAHVASLPDGLSTLVRGGIVAPPRTPAGEQRIRLAVRQVRWRGSWRVATGVVRLTIAHPRRRWRYGEEIEVRLRLRRPRNFGNPGEYDYAGTLARYGVWRTAFLWDDDGVRLLGRRACGLRCRIEDARDRLATRITHDVPGTTGALIAALVLGRGDLVPRPERERFARAGVAHVLAVSGLHVGLVGAGVFLPVRWLLGRSTWCLLHTDIDRVATVAALGVATAYGCMAGSSIATLRALIMAACLALGVLLGRRGDAHRALAAAALLIGALWPGAPREASFQLSFVAVLAVVAGVRRARCWRSARAERRRPRPAGRAEHIWEIGVGYALVALVASLATAPLTALHFNRVSLVGVVVNILLVPLAAPVCVGTALAAGVAVLLAPALAGPLIALAALVLGATAAVIGWVASLPLASLRVVTPSPVEMAAIYGVGVGLWRGGRGGRLLVLLAGAVLAVDVGTWIHARFLSSVLRVAVLSVGQGDGAVVEFPGGETMVIDAGSYAGGRFDAGERIVAPFLWRQKIARVDYLVLSHPQSDHAGGLAFLADNFVPREFWWNGERRTTAALRALGEALARQHVRRRVLSTSSPPALIGGVEVRVLHPPASGTWSGNDGSLVLRLSYGCVDLLFTGDIGAPAEAEMVAKARVLRSEFLKVPHHGSRTSSSQGFVAAVSPQLVAISVGAFNRYGFPDASVLARYRRAGGRLWRTDRDGALVLETDGRSYAVEGGPGGRCGEARGGEDQVSSQ